MPFCSKCGEEVEEEAIYCPKCGNMLKPAAEMKKVDAIEAFSRGVSIVSTKPGVLVPAIIGALIPLAISILFAPWTHRGTFSGSFWGFIVSPAGAALFLLGISLVFVGLIISFVMFFASLDMSRDAYLERELNMSESVGYVMRRLGTFIVAAIIGAILFVTVIGIPIAILMFVVMVVDETGIGYAVSKALNVLGARLMDVIILIILAIVGTAILNFIPFISSILVAAYNVLIGLAFMDIYFSYKRIHPPSNPVVWRPRGNDG